MSARSKCFILAAVLFGGIHVLPVLASDSSSLIYGEVGAVGDYNCKGDDARAPLKFYHNVPWGMAVNKYASEEGWFYENAGRPSNWDWNWSCTKAN